MKVKICGMKYKENIEAVTTLGPDYLGFIFYNKSKRNFEGIIPKINPEIKKTGVFVNASISAISSMIETHQLEAIQLHGDESTEYCTVLKDEHKQGLEIIKAFSVSDNFDFNVLEAYAPVCDYFLFDTKGEKRGGNGTLFDWKLLEKYELKKPFFLSGGIGLQEVGLLNEFLSSPLANYCYAIDVNSKFESEPGLKNVEELKEFMALIAKDK